MGIRTRGCLAAGEVKRPVEMRAWPFRVGGTPAAWSHADEEAVLVSGDPLRAL